MPSLQVVVALAVKKDAELEKKKIENFIFSQRRQLCLPLCHSFDYCDRAMAIASFCL